MSILSWLFGCNHECVAPSDHNQPIFCRKCFKQGIGRSMPNERVPSATIEEEAAKDFNEALRNVVNTLISEYSQSKFKLKARHRLLDELSNRYPMFVWEVRTILSENKDLDIRVIGYCWEDYEHKIF